MSFQSITDYLEILHAQRKEDGDVLHLGLTRTGQDGAGVYKICAIADDRLLVERVSNRNDYHHEMTADPQTADMIHLSDLAAIEVMRPS